LDRIIAFRPNRIWVEFGPSYVDIFQVSPAKVSPAQVSPTQVGCTQVVSAQIGPTQIGPIQVGPIQICTAQVGPAQILSTRPLGDDSPDQMSFLIDLGCIIELGPT